ncbi:uncharacterized protein LOC119458699 isoform X1 [Dermacentor silvarum]|nr:uncharacterized protein LOC119458699 isoform X1 [Dermacentor silvarum]
MLFFFLRADNEPHDDSTFSYKGEARVDTVRSHFHEGARPTPRRMLLFATTILLLAGLTQQQSTQELNAYVDKILKDELPSEAKLIDPLTVRGFSFHIRDHPHYAHVKFEPSTITGLSTIHRSGDCSSYSRFPYRVYVGCNVTYGVIKVHVKSQLKYDHNSTTVTADTTFPEVHGRLYVSVGAWKGPRAHAYPKLGNFTTAFTGLDENPDTQKLRWGYYEVIRDVLALSIERTLSWAIADSAGKVLWPCC